MSQEVSGIETVTAQLKAGLDAGLSHEAVSESVAGAELAAPTSGDVAVVAETVEGQAATADSVVLPETVTDEATPTDVPQEQVEAADDSTPQDELGQQVDETSVTPEEMGNLPTNIGKGVKNRIHNLVAKKNELKAEVEALRKQTADAERLRWENERMKQDIERNAQSFREQQRLMQQQIQQQADNRRLAEERELLEQMDPIERDTYEARTRVEKLERQLAQMNHDRQVQAQIRQEKYEAQQSQDHITRYSEAAMRQVGLDNDPEFVEEFVAHMQAGVGRLENQAIAQGRDIKATDIPPQFFADIANRLNSRRQSTTDRVKKEYEAKLAALQARLGSAPPSVVSSAGGVVPASVQGQSDVPVFDNGIEGQRLKLLWATKHGRLDDLFGSGI